MKGHMMKVASSDQSDAASINISVVRGVLSTEVRISDLRAGSIVYNFEVTTNVGDERHVVPVAWRDPNRPARLTIGDEIVVVGAIHRRWFRAGGASQSRTELVASNVGKVDSMRTIKAVAVAASALVDPDMSRR
jgi:single-strand DNA-binding protein